MEDARKKLKAAAHYIIRRCSSQPDKLGKTKLHKIFWYADGYAYAMRGAPIVGDRYVRSLYGPTSSQLNSVLKELESEGKIFIRTVPYHDLEKTEFTAKTEPDMSMFGEKDISLLTDIANSICEGQSAASISLKSHDDLWEAAENGEELHYGLFLVKRCLPLKSDVLAWAKQQIERRPKSL